MRAIKKIVVIIVAFSISGCYTQLQLSEKKDTQGMTQQHSAGITISPYFDYDPWFYGSYDMPYSYFYSWDNRFFHRGSYYGSYLYNRFYSPYFGSWYRYYGSRDYYWGGGYYNPYYGGGSYTYNGQRDDRKYGPRSIGSDRVGDKKERTEEGDNDNNRSRGVTNSSVRSRGDNQNRVVERSKSNRSTSEERSRGQLVNQVRVSNGFRNVKLSDESQVKRARTNLWDTDRYMRRLMGDRGYRNLRRDYPAVYQRLHIKVSDVLESRSRQIRNSSVYNQSLIRSRSSSSFSSSVNRSSFNSSRSRSSSSISTSRSKSSSSSVSRSRSTSSNSRSRASTSQSRSRSSGSSDNSSGQSRSRDN